MGDFLQKLRRKLWPLRSDFTEEEFYSLPLPKQRRILGLGEGQNPPAPSYYSAPSTVTVTVPQTTIRFSCRHGSFPNPCKDCQGTFTNAV